MECAGKAALEFSGAMLATANTPRSRSLSEYTGFGPRSSRDSARTEHRRSAKSTVNLTSLFDAETSSTRSILPMEGEAELNHCRGARSMPRVFGRGSRSQPAALVSDRDDAALFPAIRILETSLQAFLTPL
jgi:hypothetical protein